MRVIPIIIPASIAFADLLLSRTPTGSIKFDWRPIDLICEASAIDQAIFRDNSEDNVAGLIVAWYEIAIANGEPADPTAEDLIAETRLEDAKGGGISHPPGTA